MSIPDLHHSGPLRRYVPTTRRLRRSTCFRRLTGVSVVTFDRMVEQLRTSWEAAERRKTKSGRPWEVGGLENHLLIMLLYYRKRELTPTFRRCAGLSTVRVVIGEAVRDGRERVVL
jgi:hypothetical protein